MTVSPTLSFFLFSSLMIMQLNSTVKVPSRAAIDGRFGVIASSAAFAAVNEDFRAPAHPGLILALNPKGAWSIDWRIVHCVFAKSNHIDVCRSRAFVLHTLRRGLVFVLRGSGRVLIQSQSSRRSVFWMCHCLQRIGLCFDSSRRSWVRVWEAPNSRFGRSHLQGLIRGEPREEGGALEN